MRRVKATGNPESPRVSSTAPQFSIARVGPETPVHFEEVEQVVMQIDEYQRGCGAPALPEFSEIDDCAHDALSWMEAWAAARVAERSRMPGHVPAPFRPDDHIGIGADSDGIA